MAALQVVCSSSQINPATARLCRSFPSRFKFHAPDSHRPLCTRLDPTIIPLNWKTPRPSPPVKTHLPVDAMAHHTLPLLEDLSFAPVLNSSLRPDLPPLPPEGVMKAAYSFLKTKACLLMLDRWHLDHPPPPYSTFPLSLTPHPFIGLGKFIASRVHQMRTKKSYLAAHPSWSSPVVSQLCSLCVEEQETFSYSILRCPAKAAPKSRHLQGLTSVGPEAPLWHSVSLLSSRGAYIRATATNYPPDMFPSLPPSLCSMVFPSPPTSPLPGVSSPLLRLAPFRFSTMLVFRLFFFCSKLVV